ncbi:hypothetical protein ASG07_06925 [Sphingomonas sp. Leaf343]|nr:hypothetical protein ASG07_06925 [Sphingomonas sp. Leaf343]
MAASGDGAVSVDVRSGRDATIGIDELFTDGADAPALSVVAGRRATIQVGSILTGGDRSAGMIVDAASSISLTAGAITTSGKDAAGIVATSRGGDITMSLGSVSVAAVSTGVSATSYGGGVSVSVAGTTRDGGLVDGGIVATSGIALDLSALSSTIEVTGPDATQLITFPVTGAPEKAGIVMVTVDRAATVSSIDDTAIAIVAEKASTLTSNGAVTREGWWGNRVIGVQGGATTIVNNGTMTGVIRLTENGDTFTNNGTFTTAGFNAFDDNETFVGATPNRGTDTFVNTGTIRVQPDVDFTQYPVFTGVEVFRNSGLIDLRSGTAGDIAFFGRSIVEVGQGQAPILGRYIGSGNASIALDLQFEDNGAFVDTVRFGQLPGDVGANPLVVSGTTKVILNPLGNRAPKLLIGLPVIFVPSGSTGTFELAQPMSMGGLQYALLYDPRQTAWALYAAPDAAVLRQIKVPTNVQALSTRASDAVSAHLREQRDQRWSEMEPRSGMWLQVVGDSTTRNESYSATVNRIAMTGVDLSQRQSIIGVQAGIGTAGPDAGETGMIFGATAGYLQSTARFRATRDKLKIDAVGLGGYASLLAGPVFLTASASYARHSIDDALDEVGTNGMVRADSYGVRAEGGIRFGNDTFFVEPSASITYTVTSVDRVNLSFGQIAFDDLISNRGTAGARAGGRLPLGERELVFYAGGEAIHEFAGDDQARLASGELEVTLPSYRPGNYGRATLGINVTSETRMTAFAEGHGVFGKGYSGGGGRVGIRIAL